MTAANLVEENVRNTKGCEIAQVDGREIGVARKTGWARADLWKIEISSAARATAFAHEKIRLDVLAQIDHLPTPARDSCCMKYSP